MSELQSNERKDTLDLFTHQQSSDVANVFCLSDVFLVVLLAISKSHFVYVSLYSKCTQFWNYIWSNDNDRWWWNVIWWPFFFIFISLVISAYRPLPPIEHIVHLHCVPLLLCTATELNEIQIQFHDSWSIVFEWGARDGDICSCTHNRCMFTFKSSFSPPK